MYIDVFVPLQWRTMLFEAFTGERYVRFLGLTEKISIRAEKLVCIRKELALKRLMDGFYKEFCLKHGGRYLLN